MDMPNQLQWLLEYEMQAGRRYRRYATLAIVSTRPGHEKASAELIRKSMRASDAIFILKLDTIAILMGETEMEDGRAAVHRLSRRTNGSLQLCAGLACSPRDGFGVQDLIDRASRRLSLAQSGCYGPIVGSDDLEPIAAQN